MAEIICDPVLLTKLKKANKQEIDELIYVITDDGRGRLALDSDIKKKLILAKNGMAFSDEALKLLAREIQRYGGDSLVNTFRSIFNKDLVSYNEIVSDMYMQIKPSELIKSINFKKLQNPINVIKEIDITEKEIEIVKALFGDDALSLSFEERYKKSSSSTIFSKKKIAKSSLMASPLLAPIGITGLSSAPAERIIMPCVAILGCMELRLNNISEFKKKYNSESIVSLEHQQSVSKIVDEYGSDLLVFKTYDEGLISFKKVQDMPKVQISRFNSLLSSAPGLASFAELQKGGYVLCDIPLDQLANSRAVDGAKRGFMHGSDGKIQQHVNLSEADPLQAINIAGLVWSGLSIAVAQKHMQDISEKLTVIIEKLDEIFDEIEHVQVDKLKGQIKYIRSFLQQDTASLSQQELNSIENCLKENYELANTFERRLEEIFLQSMSDNKGGLFAHNQNRENILKQGQKINNLLMNYIQTMYLRITLNALLYANSDQNKGRFIKSAEEAVQKIDELGHSLGVAIQHLKARAELSNTLISSADNFIKEVTIKFQDMVNLVETSEVEAKHLYNVALEKPSYQTRFKIENGKIIEALEYQLI